MKKIVVPVMLAIILMASSAVAAPLDAFKGQKGNLDIEEEPPTYP